MNSPYNPHDHNITVEFNLIGRCVCEEVFDNTEEFVDEMTRLREVFENFNRNVSHLVQYSSIGCSLECENELSQGECVENVTALMLLDRAFGPNMGGFHFYRDSSYVKRCHHVVSLKMTENGFKFTD